MKRSFLNHLVLGLAVLTGSSLLVGCEGETTPPVAPATTPTPGAGPAPKPDMKPDMKDATPPATPPTTPAEKEKK